MQELHILAPKEQRKLLLTPFHRWTFADLSDWCCFYRVNGNYLLRFPELADFTIDSHTLDVHCTPTPNVSSATITQLYLNQILPVVQSKSGELVFHASAIVADGLAIAFVGITGRGKSTLTASFSNNGFQFLADDGLLIKRLEADYHALPSHASLRLWEDSQAAVLGTTAKPEDPLEYTSKLRFPASHEMPHYNKSCRIRRIYFLGDLETSKIEFRKLSPQEAMVELIKHSFLLDIDDRKTMATHFDAVSKLSTLDVFYRLDYPRNYDELANVRSQILVHAMLDSNRSASTA